jgi:hypothetical protein
LFLGLQRLNALEIAEERDTRMRREYRDPIDSFPEKIDQLLEALDRVRLISIMLFIYYCRFLDLHESNNRNIKAPGT